MGSTNSPGAPRAGRYTTERVVEEVWRAVQAGPRGTHTRVAAELGISSQQLSHRLAGRYGLTIDQIGIIADALDAPSGWPFIQWDEATDRDDAWETRKRR